MGMLMLYNKNKLTLIIIYWWTILSQTKKLCWANWNADYLFFNGWGNVSFHGRILPELIIDQKAETKIILHLVMLSPSQTLILLLCLEIFKSTTAFVIYDSGLGKNKNRKNECYCLLTSLWTQKDLIGFHAFTGNNYMYQRFCQKVGLLEEYDQAY